MPKSLPRSRDAMTATEFEERVAMLLRRLHDLRAAARGEPTLRRIRVKRYTVPRHEVGAHDRFISTRRRERVTAQHRRAA